MDKILKFLNHFSALLLGPLVLLIKYVLVQAFVALSYAVAAVAFVILSPALLSLFLNFLGLNSTLGIVFGILFSPVAWIASACIVPVAALVGVGVTIGDAIRIFFEALGAGYIDGWKGISENFNKPISYFASTTLLFFAIFSRSRQEPSVSRTIDLDELKQDAADFERVPLDFNETQKMIEGIQAYIDPNELKQAKALVHLEEQTQRLQEEVTRHQDLAQRLSEVNTAIVNKQVPNLDDELIKNMEISRPILLIKEYQANNQWRVVPGSTRITDYDSLKKWFKENAANPLNRDSIHSPSPYQGNKCRYVYYPFSLQCKELAESATKIDQLSSQVKQLSDNSKNQKIDLSLPMALGKSQHNFYNSQKDQPQTPPQTMNSLNEGLDKHETGGSITPYI